MRKLTMAAVVLWLVVGGASYACAATYYVDFELGDDSRDGAGVATAWKRAPGMAGFSGTYAFQQADQFIFKGGVTWPYSVFPFVINNGGKSEGERVYYGVSKDWYQGSAWSRPVFDMQSQGMKVIDIGRGVAYVTLDNIEITGQYWSGPQKYGAVTSIAVPYDATYITLRNLYIHGWTHDYGNNTADSMVAILSQAVTPYAQGTVVEYCEIEGIASHGDSGYAVFNIPTIRFNYFHDLPNAYVTGSHVPLIIHDNVINNIEDSFDPLQHENGIETFGSEDVLIYNNVITNIFAGVTVYLNGDGRNRFYNNLIYNSNPVPLQIDTVSGNTTNNLDVYANTFVSGKYSSIRVVDKGSGPLAAMTLKNNLFISNGGTDHIGVSSVCPYKAGQCEAVLNLVDVNNFNMSTTTAAAQGYRAETRYAPPRQDALGIDQGFDLKGIVGNGIGGVYRPQGAGWDMGALEYYTPVPCVDMCFYVTANGAGARNGTDWNNAFAGFPATLVRGATYFVASGDYGSYLFNTPESGTRVITIKKATDMSHGTDTGWINYSPFWGMGQAIFGNSRYIKSYWDFSGVNFSTGYWIFDGVTGQGADADSYGFTFKIDTSGKDERYLSINQAQTATFNGMTFRHTAITCSGPSAHAEVGIRSGSQSNVVSPTLQNMYVNNCQVSTMLMGESWLIEHSYFLNGWSSAQHHGVPIDVFGADRSTFRYNFVQKCPYICIEANGTVPSATLNEWDIYGNIFDPQFLTPEGIVSGASQQVVANTRIYNNTILNSNGALLWEQNIGVPVPASGNIIRNNLFYNQHGTAPVFNTNGGGTIDYGYNTFWSSSKTQAGATDQIVLSGNPFVNLTADPLQGDFHLTGPTQPGLVLPAPYDIDFDGKPRGIAGNWTRGAFEFDILGDVSGDGRVTIYDAALVLKYTVGGTLTTTQQAQADMNGDTTIDAGDAAVMAKKALGMN